MQGKSVELLFPHGAVVVEPVGRLLHGAGDQAAIPLTPLAPAGNEAGSLEDAQVLAHRRQRHAERRRQFADGVLPALQPLEQLSPARVRQRAEDGVESMVNHVV